MTASEPSIKRHPTSPLKLDPAAHAPRDAGSIADYAGLGEPAFISCSLPAVKTRSAARVRPAIRRSSGSKQVGRGAPAEVAVA
jgi:hypothetical protein